jgi:hypothetical protein
MVDMILPYCSMTPNYEIWQRQPDMNVLAQWLCKRAWGPCESTLASSQKHTFCGLPTRTEQSGVKLFRGAFSYQSGYLSWNSGWTSN